MTLKGPLFPQLTNKTIMTVNTIMLTGDSLLAFVNDKTDLIDRGELTRTDMIKDAGYIYDNGKAMYTEFYTELLRAKGVIPVTNTDTDDAAYDDLDSDTKELYDAVDAKFGEKWDHDEVMEFINQLEDIGIETADQLDDNFEYFTSEWNATREFAEQYITDVMNAQIPECVYSHVDWDSVWECELRYDFNTIEFDGDTFFFRNN